MTDSPRATAAVRRARVRGRAQLTLGDRARVVALRRPPGADARDDAVRVDVREVVVVGVAPDCPCRKITVFDC